MILFVDFDGVLHTQNIFLRRCSPADRRFLPDDEKRFVTWNHQRVVAADGKLFTHAERLALTLDTVSVDVDIRIVISSSWRTHFSLEKLISFLPARIQHRVVGMTPVLDASNPDGMRRLECETWLNMRGMASCPWLALDDMPELFFAGRYAPLPPNLVWCRNMFGEMEADEFLQKLAVIEAAGDDWQAALAAVHERLSRDKS